MQPGRVLVVDDSPTMRRNVVLALQLLARVECVEAGDGLEALERFRQGGFGLVVTNINMPGLNGLRLIQAVRAAEPAVPVLVISTEASPYIRERALRLGASRYLTKPVRADEVIGAVRGLLDGTGSAP
ncbi:MAG: response regulator [Deltaproteobacteria bacterium]|nr:response regulator [Deltaproteobacteria bacterium]